MKNLTPSLLLACFFTLTLLACQQPADEPMATTIIDIPLVVDPTSTEEPATEPAVATPTTAVTCPTPTADTSLYHSEDQGYCLLYSAGFTIEADFERPDEVLMLVGPSDQPGGQEFTRVILRVIFNGPAEGLNSEQYAEMWQRLYFPELALPTSTTTVGGHTAVIISDIPGMAAEQTALVVVDGLKYRISLEQMGELAEPATEAWELVTHSIVFFEPAGIPHYTQPDDVCPAETADTHLHINLREGFCMLYPTTFESDRRFASGFMGDSVLFDLPDFGPIHAALIMAWAGPAQGQSPHQFLEPRLESIDATTVQEAIMGGAPALTYIDPRGPFPSRQAIIVTNEQFYTIVNHPYDAQAYPDAVADVDLIWTTVTESLAFFEPWR